MSRLGSWLGGAVGRPARQQAVGGARTSRSMALAAVPVLLFLLPVLLRPVLGPFHLAGQLDPDYIYLLNGLNVLHLHPPEHTDHPGTPVQIFAAAVIAVTWGVKALSGATVSVDQAVLANPDSYLAAINVGLGLLIALASAFLGVRLYRASSRLVVALAGQLSLLLSPQVFVALFRVSAEPMLVAATLLLLGLLVPFAFAEAPPRATRASAAVGIALGLCLATKVTALPLALCLLLLPGGRAGSTALLAMVATALAVTSPIISEYGRVLHWLTRVAIHRGIYGQGEVGVPSARSLWRNARDLLSGASELKASLILYGGLLVVLLAMRRRTALSGTDRLLFVTIIVAAAQVLLVAKHPDLHYLVPGLVFLGLANAGIVAISGGRLWVTAAALALLAIGLGRAAERDRLWVTSSHTFYQASLALDGELAASGCRIIPYYVTTSVAAGLLMGDQFTGRRYGAMLADLYPSFIYYDVWSGSFESFRPGTTTNALDAPLAAERCVLLVGWPRERFPGYQIEGLPLDPQTMGSEMGLQGRIAVYRLRRTSPQSFDLN
jgi:hypothetical protein